jgi:hypothetical protein
MGHAERCKREDPCHGQSVYEEEEEERISGQPGEYDGPFGD